MSENVAERAAVRTPGAKRAGAGEYLFNLANINHILGGPDYSTANGSCVEGDRMIVGLMRMPAGTGAEAHSHPNEQWIYILDSLQFNNFQIFEHWHFQDRRTGHLVTTKSQATEAGQLA